MRQAALVDALVDELAGEIGCLPLLSTALLELWRERASDTLTLAGYEHSGGVRGVVGRNAEAAYRSLGSDERETAKRILLRLVAGTDQAVTRRRVRLVELDADDDGVAHVLAILIDNRLVVADDGTVELIHEALLEQWPRLRAWIEEDAQGRQLGAHLAQAAAEWETSGRDAGELYRGVRLAAALDWTGTNQERGGLNRLEREFLDASRNASNRANRRLRLLLAGVAGLLAAVSDNFRENIVVGPTQVRCFPATLVERRLS